MGKHRFYDNTRISAFRFCPRSYLFRHIYHWAPEQTKVWFTFGSSWHAAKLGIARLKAKEPA